MAPPQLVAAGGVVVVVVVALDFSIFSYFRFPAEMLKNLHDGDDGFSVAVAIDAVDGDSMWTNSTMTMFLLLFLVYFLIHHLDLDLLQLEILYLHHYV